MSEFLSAAGLARTLAPPVLNVVMNSAVAVNVNAPQVRNDRDHRTT